MRKTEKKYTIWWYSALLSGTLAIIYFIYQLYRVVKGLIEAFVSDPIAIIIIILLVVFFVLFLGIDVRRKKRPSHFR